MKDEQNTNRKLHTEEVLDTVDKLEAQVREEEGIMAEQPKFNEQEQQDHDRMIELQNQLDILQNDYSNLVSQNSDLQNEISNLNNSKSELLSNKEQLEKLIQSQAQKIKELQAEKDKGLVTIDALQEKLVAVVKLYNDTIERR